MPRHQSSNGNGSHSSNGEGAIVSQESIPEFMERDPQGYAKAVDYFEDGHSPGAVAALCRIPVKLARKIRDLMGERAIHAGIRAVARNLTEASQLMSERLVDEFQEIPIQTLPNALGIITDRAALFGGNPTVRIEHRSAPTPEDVKKMFDSLPKADAVDVTGASPEPRPGPIPQRRLKQAP